MVSCSFERDPSESLSYLSHYESGARYLVIDDNEKRKTFLINKSMGNPAWGKMIRTQLLIDNNIYFAENIFYEDDLWGGLIHLYTESVMILEAKLYHYFINSSSTVLIENSGHHLDWLTAMIIKWKEWEVRNIFDLFYHELEYDFLITLNHIPDYKSSPYIKEGLTEFQKLLMTALSNQMSKREFNLLVQNAKIYLAIHG